MREGSVCVICRASVRRSASAFVRREEQEGGEKWQLSLAKRKTNKLQFDAEPLLFKVEAEVKKCE